MGPGEVEVQTIDFPSFTLQAGPGVPEENVGRECHHGVILRIVSTNICGSDQHMVRGRTTAPVGQTLGHEITGEVIEAGRDVLLDIDWQGTQQLKQVDPDIVRVFILPPSMKELERRLRARGTDSDEIIQGRMERAAGEISHWAEYDYVLINEDAETCLAKVQAILDAERLKATRRIGLHDFVRSLIG